MSIAAWFARESTTQAFQFTAENITVSTVRMTTYFVKIDLVEHITHQDTGRGMSVPNGLDLVELEGPAEPMTKRTRICGSEVKKLCWPETHSAFWHVTLQCDEC